MPKSWSEYQNEFKTLSIVDGTDEISIPLRRTDLRRHRNDRDTLVLWRDYLSAEIEAQRAVLEIGVPDGVRSDLWYYKNTNLYGSLVGALYWVRSYLLPLGVSDADHEKERLKELHKTAKNNFLAAKAFNEATKQVVDGETLDRIKRKIHENRIKSAVKNSKDADAELRHVVENSKL